MLSTGVLTGKGFILTLLVGDVLKGLLTMVRFLTPYYVGILVNKNRDNKMAFYFSFLIS